MDARTVALAVCSLCLLLPARAQAQTVRPEDAAQYVGQVVTVEGQVAQVSVSRRSNTTFLNFGARYPDHVFTAVIFRSAAGAFPNAAQWEGRRVRVSGRVRMYRGKPEIVLESPSQLAAAP